MQFFCSFCRFCTSCPPTSHLPRSFRRATAAGPLSSPCSVLPAGNHRPADYANASPVQIGHRNASCSFPICRMAHPPLHRLQNQTMQHSGLCKSSACLLEFLLQFSSSLLCPTSGLVCSRTACPLHVLCMSPACRLRCVCSADAAPFRNPHLSTSPRTIAQRPTQTGEGREQAKSVDWRIDALRAHRSISGRVCRGPARRIAL